MSKTTHTTVNSRNARHEAADGGGSNQGVSEWMERAGARIDRELDTERRLSRENLAAGFRMTNLERGKADVCLGYATVIDESPVAIRCHVWPHGTERKGDYIRWIPRNVLAETSEVLSKHDSGMLRVRRWWADQQGAPGP